MSRAKKSAPQFGVFFQVPVLLHHRSADVPKAYRTEAAAKAALTRYLKRMGFRNPGFRFVKQIGS